MRPYVYWSYDLPDEPPEHPVARVIYYIAVLCTGFAYLCLGLVALIFLVGATVGLVRALG